MEQLVHFPLTTQAHPCCFFLWIGHFWAQGTVQGRVFPVSSSSFPMNVNVSASSPVAVCRATHPIPFDFVWAQPVKCSQASWARLMLCFSSSSPLLSSQVLTGILAAPSAQNHRWFSTFDPSLSLSFCAVSLRMLPSSLSHATEGISAFLLCLQTINENSNGNGSQTQRNSSNNLPQPAHPPLEMACQHLSYWVGGEAASSCELIQIISSELNFPCQLFC